MIRPSTRLVRRDRRAPAAGGRRRARRSRRAVSPRNVPTRTSTMIASPCGSPRSSTAWAIASADPVDAEHGDRHRDRPALAGAGQRDGAGRTAPAAAPPSPTAPVARRRTARRRPARSAPGTREPDRAQRRRTSRTARPCTRCPDDQRPSGEDQAALDDDERPRTRSAGSPTRMRRAEVRAARAAGDAAAAGGGDVAAGGGGHQRPPNRRRRASYSASDASNAARLKSGQSSSRNTSSE